MSADDSLDRTAPSPRSLDDVLSQLTTAHAEMLDRHGPLLGMEGVARPIDAPEFAGDQARLAARQDAEPNPPRRVSLMLEREAQQHEQIGRLASFVAGYTLAHGDPGDVEPMQQLGGDHFDIAAKIRKTLAVSAARAHSSDNSADLMPPDILAEVRAKSANQNDPDHGL